jgi:hypothetical protein
MYASISTFSSSWAQAQRHCTYCSLHRHSTPLRARRPSATSSNWTRLDAPAAGVTCPSCAGRSRSMRRTENVRNTPSHGFEVLRANGAFRPHAHRTLRCPNSGLQRPAPIHRRVDRLPRPLADYTLATHRHRGRRRLQPRRLPGQRMPRLAALCPRGAGACSRATAQRFRGSCDQPAREGATERLDQSVRDQGRISEG